MNFKKTITLLLLLALIIIPVNSFADDDDSTCKASIAEGDSDSFQLYSFYDLRDRETFVQITNTNNPNFSGAGSDITIHVQIFDVGNLCNENDFFDTLTPNDTHVYNMRDILTNNGTPSGVDLPADSYGIVIISLISSFGFIQETTDAPLIGNFRVIDNLGYEYRANISGLSNFEFQTVFGPFGNGFFSFNFNQQGNVTLSDVVGISIGDTTPGAPGVDISDPATNFITLDVDLYNNNEVPFSCRNVIFSCVAEGNPRIEELLEVSAGFGTSASVARYEYGINETIPHSKGGELLCPNNIIGEGTAVLTVLHQFDEDGEGTNPFFAGYIGLNNGNGRGSMDSFWAPNNKIQRRP